MLEYTRVVFRGVVQGVGFRPTAYRVASSMGLRGYVRNNGSNVEVVVDGRAEDFVRSLLSALSPLARVEEVSYESIGEGDVLSALGRSGDVGGFTIVQSRRGSRDSPIPADTGICGPCLRELFDSGNRRHLFPFINCTDCGARFSVISDVPYDRKNTSMTDFHLCRVCRSEYESPDDRRFHAQTISCPDDGPRYTLYDGAGRVLVPCGGGGAGSRGGMGAPGREWSGGGSGDWLAPIEEAARRVDGGQIGVVKGWGGMHIVCRIEECARLREWYRRPAKPFAVMFRDIEAVRRVALVDAFAETLLTSPQRPIVLLPKRHPGELECVSPGLGNIGCYLPYSGLHHVLFSKMRASAVIMTSANPAGEPMITENDGAFSLGLGFCLLHNRRVVSRTDDSVVIPFRGRRFFIRKSRGYVPDGVPVPYRASVLSLGAEKNVTSAVSKDCRLYATQYIGNTTRYRVQLFLESATEHLMRLLGVERAESVVVDMHPQYASRRLGVELAERWGARVNEVQHHWAHAASLMLDCGLGPDERVVTISADGAGYGPDGTVWGGEVLLAGYRGFERVGTIETFPLLGGDAAVRDPPRIVLALLDQAGLDWREWGCPGLGDERPSSG